MTTVAGLSHSETKIMALEATQFRLSEAISISSSSYTSIRRFFFATEVNRTTFLHRSKIATMGFQPKKSALSVSNLLEQMISGSLRTYKSVLDSNSPTGRQARLRTVVKFSPQRHFAHLFSWHTTPDSRIERARAAFIRFRKVLLFPLLGACSVDSLRFAPVVPFTYISTFLGLFLFNSPSLRTRHCSIDQAPCSGTAAAAAAYLDHVFTHTICHFPSTSAATVRMSDCGVTTRKGTGVVAAVAAAKATEWCGGSATELQLWRRSPSQRNVMH